MPKAKAHEKGILCVEGGWSPYEQEDRESVKPALEFISVSFSVPLVHRTACTKEEFEFVINNIIKPNFAHGNQKKYGVLYLAFHGSPGAIHLSDQTKVTLQDLSILFKNKFRGLILYFGSCSVLDLNETELLEFKEMVGATALIGYKNSVDWVDSALCDIAAISLLQSYINIGSFRKAMNKQYGELIERLGFHVVF